MSDKSCAYSVACNIKVEETKIKINENINNVEEIYKIENIKNNTLKVFLCNLVTNQMHEKNRLQKENRNIACNIDLKIHCMKIMKSLVD